MNDKDLRKLIKDAESHNIIDVKKVKLLLNNILTVLRKILKHDNHDIPKLKK